ncbi:hypothetical protein CANCADRAFT_109841 [Tortispora caseinolytica NRRL Y-17796]|uniref:Transcriptional coactivator p15 (PC4) C-terminal domain-containing protein n=1 Tax=Tortispora caseinolytica NRRL Y-17796 TaxID=767744 RepID=A0A1E4TG00_9ASCO|nr:hypothetical protein CANCADRAFT_109841 [Tortispora caseinolytica NRRL Y-17796]
MSSKKRSEQKIDEGLTDEVKKESKRPKISGIGRANLEVKQECSDDDDISSAPFEITKEDIDNDDEEQKQTNLEEDSTALDVLEKDGDGYYISLSGSKRITISKFKNRPLISIREYYMDTNSGEYRPGKKGIALSIQVWREIMDNIPAIDVALKKIDA